MSKNKVGLAIVTYTVNYGTFLQAFATQTSIRKLGYDTEILNIDSVIDDVTRKRRRYFLRQIINTSELKSYRSTISAILAKKFVKKYKSFIALREAKFKKFKDEFFIPGQLCNSWLGLQEHCRNFSSVVVGSDQLWRPANIAGNFYTLNFVPDDINKVSYSTSFGLSKIRDDQEEVAKNFLSRIQHLSCREESGANIIKELTGRTAAVVCDPTLLLTKEWWGRFLQEEPLIKEEYILMYLLGDNKKHREYVRNLAKKTKCKIIGVLHGAGYIYGDEAYVDEAPSDIGPFDFLNLIQHAKYVCTDSFHGCVFSIIFERDFYVFKRFSDCDKMSTNNRVIGLINRMGLADRMVENYELLDLNPIDYHLVNRNLNDFRTYSMKYLTESLQ